MPSRWHILTNKEYIRRKDTEKNEKQTSTVSISFVEPEDPKLLEEFRKEQGEYKNNRIKGFRITIVNALGSPERIFRPIH